jgi:uncharacterized protein
VRIAVTGSSGFIGRALVRRLEDDGHDVVRLLRPGSKPRARSALWDPQAGTIDVAAFEGTGAVVHLAGASIGARPWTGGFKQKILRSGVQGTRLLARTLAGLAGPPPVLASASAVGWYGDRGDEILDEGSAAGEGFRAFVCRQWEAATEPAAEAGIPTVMLRFGIVLGGEGGLLPVLAAPARLGLGTRLGDGRQFVSWVSIRDAVGAVVFAIGDPALRGPVNVTAPEPVTNAVFARALSAAVGRPRIGWGPRWAVELLAGPERAREVLLSSQRVLPANLLAAGFPFEYPALGGALAAALYPTGTGARRW